MAFARNTLFGINISREVLTIYSPAAAGVGQWRSVSLGSEAVGQVDVADTDIGLSAFPFDGAGAPPVGAPPVGSRVQIQQSPFAWAFGLPVSQFKVTMPGPAGVLYAYFSVSTLGGATFAIVILESGDLFQCLPEELALLQLP